MIRRSSRKAAVVKRTVCILGIAVKADLIFRLISVRREIERDPVGLSRLRYNAGVDIQPCLPHAAVIRVLGCFHDAHIHAVSLLVSFDHIAGVMTGENCIRSVESEVFQRNFLIGFRNVLGRYARCYHFVKCKVTRKQFTVLVFDLLNLHAVHRDLAACRILAEHQLQHDFFSRKAGHRNGKRLGERCGSGGQMLSVQCRISLFNIVIIEADLKIQIFIRRHIRADAVALASLRYSTGTDKQL